LPEESSPPPSASPPVFRRNDGKAGKRPLDELLAELEPGDATEGEDALADAGLPAIDGDPAFRNPALDGEVPPLDVVGSPVALRLFDARPIPGLPAILNPARVLEPSGLLGVCMVKMVTLAAFLMICRTLCSTSTL
jgi:hypothetical protein